MARVKLYWQPGIGFLALNPETGNVLRVPIQRDGWRHREVYSGTLAGLKPSSEVSEAILVAVATVTGMPLTVGDGSDVPTLTPGRALAEVQLLSGMLSAAAGPRREDDYARAV